MDSDPYAGLVALMRGQALDTNPAGDSRQAGVGAVPVRMRFGTVESVAPLRVKVAGKTMPTEILKINERLVKGARWRTKTTSPNSDYNTITGPISGPVDTPHGTGALVCFTDGEVHSADTTIDEATVEQLEIDLEVGDAVLLLTEDDQVFYIIMKVVDAV